MGVVKTFDSTKMVLDEASERFARYGYKPNEQNIDILRDYCEAIDEILAEFNGESFEVEVDEESMNIYMTLECGEIVIETPEHKLYKLMDRALGVSFAAAKDCDHVMVKFTFPSLWEKV